MASNVAVDIPDPLGARFRPGKSSRAEKRRGLSDRGPDRPGWLLVLDQGHLVRRPDRRPIPRRLPLRVVPGPAHDPHGFCRHRVLCGALGAAGAPAGGSADDRRYGPGASSPGASGFRFAFLAIFSRSGLSSLFVRRVMLRRLKASFP